jgi:hypothetical protein
MGKLNLRISILQHNEEFPEAIKKREYIANSEYVNVNIKKEQKRLCLQYYLSDLTDKNLT